MLEGVKIYYEIETTWIIIIIIIIFTKCFICDALISKLTPSLKSLFIIVIIILCIISLVASLMKVLSVIIKIHYSGL